MTRFAEVAAEITRLEKTLDLELWNGIGTRRSEDEVAFYYIGLEQLRLVRQQEGRKIPCQAQSTKCSL